MKIKIEVETGNEAMKTWQDVRLAIQSALARKTFGNYTPAERDDGIKIMDLNGNTVGKVTVVE